MTKTWFTSDTHFGHANIIGYCKRPFANVHKMDWAIINNWNNRVGEKDVVWHLGDFCLGGLEEATAYRNYLNGTINFVWGNHDRTAVRAAGNNHFAKNPLWQASGPFFEINLDGHRITLCHYAMRVWNQCHRGAIQLFGHSHNNMPCNSQSLDVGVDSWDYTPISLEQILRRMATLPKFVPEDHHRG